MGVLDDRPPMPGRAWTRVRDRRAGFAECLALLAASLDREPPALRIALERALRRLVPVRQVDIRESAAGTARFAPRAESICLEVPTPQAARPALLEAVFDPACGLDEWDFQLLDTARHLAALVLEIDRLRARPGAAPPMRLLHDGSPALVGSSPAMRALRERIARVAATDFTVLIEGESGTGKELVARQIHALSPRRRGPFVAVNCAALVESLLEAELFGIEDRTATGVRGRRGKFEHADEGTLFLDEVSDLSLAAQAKLLRAIQEMAVQRVGGHGVHRVNARIVVATNRSLAAMVERGTFRSDLFYRLSGIEILVPPLRGRRDDVGELAAHFLDRHQAMRSLALSPAAMDALVAYEWPGNVRELERVLERAVALTSSEAIELQDLPPALNGAHADILLPSVGRNDTMRAWGSRYARLVLERCRNNKRQACRELGITYHTLRAYLRFNPDNPRPHTERAPERWMATVHERPPRSKDAETIDTCQSPAFEAEGDRGR
jgi:DNA-binding NtrC family response regulator